ncbi:DNA topoisomerase [Coniosporium apollinis]|uniref:DNA topoisomerase n=2 Tax=Coniosporium TaxID=2810619 RepID=A0ABQ9P0Z3_9PEZI|nr:DNA topoisomerase [Cladosporium sp. JES 115]KAJ9668266.1 DNA topoisomerase [Coniosporium apollinis]
MGGRIFCVAEKPSIAKAVAQHLGGQVQARNVPGIQWVKNYEFSYTFPPWGACTVVFTSVAGHLHTIDFDTRYRSWNSCQPGQLFDAPVVTSIDDDKKAIARNIETQARGARTLFIWTDCDREGEHIGTEIRDVALKSNPRLEVVRARFSNIERVHVVNAARNPVPLDERQANAVAARIELDLRIGAAFTRMQTLQLRPMVEQMLESKVISYGSCQFPTLGFVVDRYFRVKNFVPEQFWHIRVMHRKDDIDVTFNWKRGHLFDRMAVTIIFERCIMARMAKVVKMQKKPTSKWKPLPLTTVELQKMGSRFLRMDSQRVMKIAEELYTKGWISYPRTETDQFDRGIDLRKLVEKQCPDGQWGPYAQGLMNGGFNQPRQGRNNDKAHPPIHPVNHVAASHLRDDEERRVYEFIVRRFLACCSEDAKGEATDVEIQYGTEIFRTHGLIVLQRNYLDVYPYDKWVSSQQLPNFTVGETFEPTEAKMLDGKTTAPGFLTEPELIALMDANGIGTDATMAEHIAKIKERAYVMTRPRGRATGGGAEGDDNDDGETGAARGGRGGRGRGRGRGGGRGGTATTGRGGGTGLQEFIPTTLGVALIEGYDNVGFETSLGKPFLRKEMELQMRAICAGTTTRNDVVHQSLEQYREVFVRTTRQINVLKESFRKYILPQDQQG